MWWTLTLKQSKAAVANAQVTTTRQRLIRSKSATINLQVLLGVALMCILVVILGVSTIVGITKPPTVWLLKQG